MRRWLALLLAAAALLSGCGPQQEDPPARDTDGIPLRLTVRATAAQETLDPARAAANGSGTLVHHLYENLLRWEDDGQGGGVLAPGMAQEYTVDSDEVNGVVTYTFRLRDDAKWSDGKAVTAYDFVYSWQRLFGMENPPGTIHQLSLVDGFDQAWAARDGSLLSGVTAPDRRTFVVTTDAQCAYFLDTFCAGTLTMPVREDLVERYGAGWGAEAEALVTNGPYTLQSLAGDCVTVAKNEHYYDAGSVTVDEIVFRWTGDAAGAYQALLSGELDFLRGLPEEEVAARFQAGVLDLEAESATSALLLNNLAAPFDNDFVRQAFAVCVDPAALVAAAEAYTATPATGFVPHGVANRDDQFVPPVTEEDPDQVVLPEDLLAEEEQPQEPEVIRWDYRAVGDYGVERTVLSAEERAAQAQRLIAQGGYPDGLGFPEVEFLFIDAPENQRVAAYLRDLWRETLGVTVNLQPLAEEELRATLLDGAFTLAAFRFDAAYNDAMAFLQRWHSGALGLGGNVIGFSNRAYDLLIYVVPETGSLSAREACLHDAEELLLESCGVIPLYYYGRTSQLAEGLTGLYALADGTYFFRSVTRLPASEPES